MSIIALQKNKTLYKFMYDKNEKKNLLKLMTGKTGLMFGGILPEEIEEHILSFLIPYKNLFQEIKDDLQHSKDELEFYFYTGRTNNFPYEGCSGFAREINKDMLKAGNSRVSDYRDSFTKPTWATYDEWDEDKSTKLFKKHLGILKYNTLSKKDIIKRVIPYFFQFQKLKWRKGHNWVHPITWKTYNKKTIYDMIDVGKDFEGLGNKKLIKLIMSF